ncbi:MAG: polyprenyl synthetase family protein [Candidatus Caldarchaeum sp.]|nr:polyprenyl synthetase family protein [Candidatus Caldarchaeum sp.]MDW7977756.1 polyprenyl synthetase family protein [Candidatus Caldarchaeum sp.]
MSSEEEVVGFLTEYATAVERAVEKHIPTVFTENYLLKQYGRPRFSYSPRSFTEGLAKPFWELFSRGGKRWRPALTILTYEALGGDVSEIMELAAVPEIIHNATLMVDDVEDSSLMRRGKPCIHRLYGVDIAVNAGNALYYLPIHILTKNLEERKACMLLRKYVEMMVKLSLGQTMDIVWHKALVADVSEEDYLQMASFKTGALSRFSVELACVYAGRNELIEELGDFGETIGTAFQIQDDYLNIFGEEEKYRKEIGGDITEGKYTLMTVYALRHLPQDKSRRLREILAEHTSDPQKVREAIDLIKQSGAGEYAKSTMRKIVEKAWLKVDRILPPSHAKVKLGKLVGFLVERTV